MATLPKKLQRRRRRQRLGRVDGLCASPLHNPKEKGSGEAYRPSGKTRNIGSHGKSRCLLLNVLFTLLFS